MRVRLGYVAIALNLEKVTSSSTFTYARYSKMKSEEERLQKLKEITYSNIEALEQILKYNIENNIHFYRLTSNLVPLATHPEVMWDFIRYFKKDFEFIGKIINNNHIRVDAHPDQFNVINSQRQEVVESTLRNLNLQVDIFEAMNINNGKMVIHIGSGQGGKDDSSDRFVNNLSKFPGRVRDRLILENDDKVFSAKDVLDICQRTKLPMVLDVHHHICKNDGEDIGDLLDQIFDTWNGENILPKIHFSSPREFINDRKHSDFIDLNSFIDFIELAKQRSDRDFDVMIEAKKKDIALFELINDLKKIRSDIKFIDETTIEL